MKFHFMNGTMRATSSKKMTAILLGLTMTLAPYGMTSADAVQAAEHPAAAAAVTTEAAAPQAANAADGKAAAEKAEAAADKEAGKDEAKGAVAAQEVVTIDARSSLDQDFDWLAEVKNGTYDFNLAASTPRGSTGLTSDITFVSEPYARAKGTMHITVTLPGAPAFDSILLQARPRRMAEIRHAAQTGRQKGQ